MLVCCKAVSIKYYQYVSHTNCKEKAAVTPYSCVSTLLLLHSPLGAEDLCQGLSPRNLKKYSCQEPPLQN